MRPLLHKIKPAAGVAPLLHVAFRIALPIAVFVLSSLSIGIWLPLLVIFLSKWRIFAVRPRFWLANLRANAVDIMVGIAIVVAMAQTDSLSIRLIWAVVYGVWLLFIKPKSGTLPVSIQSAIGQLAGLMALFIAWPEGPLLGLVLATGLICYLAARHFFDSYSEPYAKMLSYLWGYFGAALMWVLGHLLVVYPGRDGPIAQPTLFLSIIGYTLGATYYLEHYDKLSLTIRRELIFVCAGAMIILLASLFYEGLHLIS
ncbi:MAG TPA: hypothetical protein VF575_00210 [Candidatus Saccharimonadales bacterium]|jgi:hypothetical protein